MTDYPVPTACETPRSKMTIKRQKELMLYCYEVEEYMFKKLKIKLSPDEVCQFGSVMQHLLSIRRDEVR